MWHIITRRYTIHKVSLIVRIYSKRVRLFWIPPETLHLNHSPAPSTHLSEHSHGINSHSKDSEVSRGAIYFNYQIKFPSLLAFLPLHYGNFNIRQETLVSSAVPSRKQAIILLDRAIIQFNFSSRAAMSPNNMELTSVIALPCCCMLVGIWKRSMEQKCLILGVMSTFRSYCRFFK